MSGDREYTTEIVMVTTEKKTDGGCDVPHIVPLEAIVFDRPDRVQVPYQSTSVHVIDCKKLLTYYVELLCLAAGTTPMWAVDESGRCSHQRYSTRHSSALAEWKSVCRLVHAEAYARVSFGHVRHTTTTLPCPECH